MSISSSARTASKDIWPSREKGGPRLTEYSGRVRLGFNEAIAVTVGADALVSKLKLAAASMSSLLGDAIKAMRLARADLKHLAPEQPQSFLPELSIAKRGVRQFGLFSTEIAVSLNAPAMPEWGVKDPYRKDGWIRPGLGLTLGDPDQYPAKLKAAQPGQFKAIELNARLASFHGTKTPSSDSFPIELHHDIAAWFGDAGERPVMFKVVAGSATTSKRRTSGVLGGLRFRRAGAQSLLLEEAKERDYSHLRLGGRDPIAVIDVPGAADDQLARAGNLELRLRLAIDQVEPISVDIRRGDRTGRSQPLLINEAPVTSDTVVESPFILDIKETISGGADWRLTAALYERVEERSGVGQFVVVSEEPFAVSRFYSRPIEARGDQATIIVASYDSDTRMWELKQVSRLYHYIYPPQAVGESMDKPRRLEIHDLPELGSGEDKKLGFYRPYPANHGSIKRHVVEFRLTPSAEIWIRPTDVERGFFLPEWASHEIFRQRSELGLGAALEALRGEFLYGLAVGVSTSKETGLSRRARVAEIEALTGTPVGAARASNPDTAMRDRWDRLRKAIARRPERLEIWADDPDSDIAFAPARFRSGVQFALRDTALHRAPVLDLDPPRAEPEQPAQELAGLSPRIHSRGLSGGALWPIESKNVFVSLLTAPSSTGGQIERIALSPLGGDADQKAEFYNGKIAIVSETRNGFVQRQRFEVIGRIAVFWHRAKHVVVYERTVNTTAQFTPEEGLGAKGPAPRTRRPVLRKVSEYIELLEPERSYPDFAAAAAQTCGFLRTVRFNSKIIFVDSAWSEDLEDFGWKIPLWNRYAARLRPQVYPRPDIAFVTAAEGEGSDPLAAQECLNPDNIYFFTDTKAGNDRTDLWEPRTSIDCANLPAPSHAWQRPAASDEAYGNGEAGRGNAGRVPRGHARFTWRLAPPSQRTAINAGRSSKPVYAALDTITFMRSVAAQGADADTEKLKSIATVDLGTPQPGLFAGYWRRGGTLVKSAVPQLATTATSLQAVLNTLPKPPDQLPDEAQKAEITVALEALKGELEALAASSGIANAVAEARKLGDKLQDAKDLIPTGVSQCHEIADNFAGTISRKKLIILESVRSWEAAAQKDFDALPSKSEVRRRLLSGIETAITPLLRQASTEVGKVQRSIESTRGTVRDVDAELEAIFEGALAAIDGVQASIDAAKPWSRSRLDEFERNLGIAIGRVAENATVAVDDAAQRLASETDSMAQKVASVAARALRDITAGNTGIVKAIGQARTPVSERIAAIEASARALLEANGGDNVFEATRKKLEAAKNGQSDAVKEQLDNLIHLVNDAESAAKQATSRAVEIRGWLDGFAGDISEVVRSAAEALTQAAATVQALQQQVLAAIQGALSGLETAFKDEIRSAADRISGLVAPYTREFLARIRDGGGWIDSILASARAEITRMLRDANLASQSALRDIDYAAEELVVQLGEIQGLLSPDSIMHEVLLPLVKDRAIDPLLNGLGDSFFPPDGSTDNASAKIERLRAAIATISHSIGIALDDVETESAVIAEELKKACQAVGEGIDYAFDYLKAKAVDFLKPVTAKLEELKTDILPNIDEILSDLDKFQTLYASAQNIDRDIRKFGNDLARSREMAEAYGERVLDAVANVTKGGALAAPNNILRLYAAAASAPELPNLDFARERLGYYYGQLNEIIDTTPVEAWFGRLGDELKALGLSLPFSKIGDRLLPDDLSKFDIGRVLKNLGGIKLDKLFKGYKLPPGAKDAIRVTHDFDKKQFRAWAQVDIDLPMPGRRALFTVGPFKLDFVNSSFRAFVRLEASKDTDQVEQSGNANLGTDIEAVVSGQKMVALRKVAVRFDKGSGLRVDFDPKNIELNSVFQFIQNTLGTIFGDEIGGVRIIKSNGIPVGVSHDFSIPPLSLMYGTSGVTNIQISNEFQLIAFPDFLIANRFSLAKPELPFIFSVFIIGGTGWLTVDAEYRPFRNELLVIVEAAAGGSASLGFAFGGVTGSVAITISVAVTYRKLIGSSGGGLTVSLVVLIVGNVDVLGIINVYIALLLRLSYRETGDIDALGTLLLKIRISRFFKISVRRDVRYHMKGGKTQKSSSTSMSTEITDPKIKSAKEKAEKLLKSQK